MGQGARQSHTVQPMTNEDEEDEDDEDDYDPNQACQVHAIRFNRAKWNTLLQTRFGQLMLLIFFWNARNSITQSGFELYAQET